MCVPVGSGLRAWKWMGEVVQERIVQMMLISRMCVRVRVRVCMWLRLRVQQIDQPVDEHDALLGV